MDDALKERIKNLSLQLLSHKNITPKLEKILKNIPLNEKQLEHMKEKAAPSIKHGIMDDKLLLVRAFNDLQGKHIGDLANDLLYEFIDDQKILGMLLQTQYAVRVMEVNYTNIFKYKLPQDVKESLSACTTLMNHDGDIIINDLAKALGINRDEIDYHPKGIDFIDELDPDIFQI